MSSETINIVVNTNTVVRILLLGFLGFLVSMIITPLYTDAAYRRRWWKRPRKTAVTGEKAAEFTKLHAKKHERNIPTMAGLVFVAAVAIVTVLANLSRSETWLPLAAFVGAGAVGLIDDFIKNHDGKGVSI